MRQLASFPGLRLPFMLALGLVLAGVPGAARAAVCSVDAGSALGSGLLDSGPGGLEDCGVDAAQAGEPLVLEDPAPMPEPGGGLELLSLSVQTVSTGGYDHCQYARRGGHGGHGGCDPPVVPLPASSWLLISGALAMLALVHRRRLTTA